MERGLISQCPTTHPSSHLVVLQLSNICNYERLHECHPVLPMDFGLKEDKINTNKCLIKMLIISVKFKI